MAVAEKLNVARVAIIGAGPSGLAAAKYLLAEKKFSKVRIFEQRATAGGVWNYTPEAKEQGFSLPRTAPSRRPDQAIWPKDGGSVEFMSAIYDSLETNIPHSLMNFTDREFPQGSSLFPRHSAVLQYLKDYAQELTPYISYETQVLDVAKTATGPWRVETLDLKTQQPVTEDYDAVVVGSGHYNDPFIPDIPGLVAFDKAYPDAISHSKFYRRADDYAGKKVIVVGNSASGVDVSIQLSAVAKLPILVSEREKPTPGQLVEEKSWAANVPEIAEFLPDQRAVRFINGQIEKDIDAVIFCTGFHYSYPFLNSLEPSIVVPSGSHAAHLWEHILYTADPTLAFLSVPQRVVPFPIAEAQSAVLARIWSGRLRAPTRTEMDAWVTKEQEQRGAGKAIQLMAFPTDVDYINRLYSLSATASKAPELGLENDGEGKRPPYWGLDKRWVRERVPKIKIASRAVGERRHEIKTLQDLGFDYDEWKKTVEAGEKLF
ncbi:hypothetical protein G7046_g9814 [Stylonectria norvegica]|nr:hypothetical protein G7046_g9814 [Stylonectria norvegica]